MGRIKKFFKYFACYAIISAFAFLYSDTFTNDISKIISDTKKDSAFLSSFESKNYISPHLKLPEIIKTDGEPEQDIRKLIDADDPEQPEKTIYLKKKHLREIVISAVGDLSLASNYIKPYPGSFYELYDLYGPEYFGENISHIFKESDYTIANLECVLTDNEDPAIRQDKTYCYKGRAVYAGILTEMGIDAVNLANNHTYDYSQEGYSDTTAALENENIKYFGNGEILIEKINGIKIGFIGILSEHRASQLPEALAYLEKSGADIKIVVFHWGNMSETTANSGQIAAGRFAIDCGADLVVGHHPHVLQGIEEYKGRYIVYSLGNFIFDGSVISDIENRTSVIFQQRFVLSGTEIIENNINLIPILVTSNMSRNNFRPVLADENQKEDILRKIGQRGTYKTETPD